MMMGRVGVDLWRMMAVAASLRVALVAYGEWQDAHMEVRYTDVDYVVFSDAAALMASGRSPFERSTYRYSPLLAAILLPNSLLHPTWGKFLFSFADLLVGLFTYIILKKRGVPEVPCLYSVAAWLFNPFTFTIGTRGNCEPIVCAVILWIIICLMDGYVLQASLWYGLVVHFRIYPIIYSIPLVIVLNKAAFGPSKPLLNCTQEMEKSNSYARISDLLKMFSHPLQLLRNSLTRERVMFTLLSGSIFFICSTFFFYIYGWDFLHEALLYHLTRVDPRHNFSLYFYHIYLSHQSNITILEKLVSFLPQLMVQAVLILCFAQDLPFCFFVQTVAFVAFNKVITAQYFVWFFCLLPLILPWSTMKFKGKGLVCIIGWMLAQVHWLAWAYLLEFKGRNVFIQLWLASILFLVANTYVLVNIIRHHIFSPVFLTAYDETSLPDREQSTISGLFLSLTFIMPSFMGFRRWYFYGATTRIYTS